MSWQDVVDRAIEIPVVTSYTRIGPAVRSRIDHWTPLDDYDLTGRTMVITGATSGLGKAAAEQLAACGATVALVARNRAKAEGIAAELIETSGNESIDIVLADLGELDSVRAAADQLLAAYGRIDVLIHNAGALTDDRRVAPDGTELTVASQVVGPFLLTTLLLDRLRASAPSRVITMSSGGMYTQPLTVSKLEMSPDDYKGSAQYARAKRAQVTLNEMWAERFEGSGIVFHALHPGWADTPGVEESLPTFRKIVGPLLRSPESGADTLVWLAADDGEPLRTTGDFWLDRRRRSIHLTRATRRSDTPDRRAALWAYCEEKAGVSVPDPRA